MTRLAVLALALVLALPASASAAAKPSVQGRSAIVVEGDSGDVLYARGADRERPIASTTKLMTALLTLENVALSDVFTAPSYDAGPAESKIGLRPGERMAVRDLMRALLLPSANDAAATLADGVAGSSKAFVRQMNRRARRLGLKHTHYSNPVGLDEGRNYSSARDLVTLARRLRRNAFFRHTTNLAHAKLRTGDRRRTVDNRNTLLGIEPWVNGVKTGHTNKAGYVLVGSATRKGVTVVSAVLGDGSEGARNADTLALLRYGLGSLRRTTPLRKGQRVATAKLDGREEDSVVLNSGETVHQVVRRGRRPQVRLQLPKTVKGPLPAGARVGTALILVDGRVRQRVPVVTAAPVPEVGSLERLLGPLYGGGGIALGLVLLALAGGSLWWAMSRRRARDRRATRRQVGAT